MTATVAPPKIIYVLGCNHALQTTSLFTQEEQLPQIEEFKKELKILAATYRFDLYCEEMKHSDFSIAERHAIDRRKRYVNIDMPKDTAVR